MKKILVSFGIGAILLTSCSGEKNHEHENNSSTHTHDDGTVHQDHNEQPSLQEEFNVSPDSTTIAPPDSAHIHDHEHPHSH